MITNKIKYGGVVQIGDFLGVGGNYGMMFGWYSGNGASGTVQYITPLNIVYEFNQYNTRMAKGTPTLKDKRGFSLDNIPKDHVRLSLTNRAVKITCPDDCFTGAELQKYLEAKRILTDMKFLKQLNYDSRKTSPV